MRYALKMKSSYTFICVSKTPFEFQNKVNRAYVGWRGMQGRGTNVTIYDFLTDYDKVEITIKPYEDSK